MASHTLQALKELERRRVPVLVATSRRRWSARKLLASNGLELPAVLLNGSLGYDYPDGLLFHSQPFDAIVAAQVLATFEAAGLTPMIYLEADDIDVVTTSSMSSGADYRAYLGERLTISPDLQTYCASVPIYSFTIIKHADRDRLTAIAASLTRNGVVAVVSADKVLGDWTLDVAPPEVTKWSGVIDFCKHRNLDSNQVLAVGDGDNDIALLTHAKTAIAMNDSTE